MARYFVIAISLFVLLYCANDNRFLPVAGSLSHPENLSLADPEYVDGTQESPREVGFTDAPLGNINFNNGIILTSFDNQDAGRSVIGLSDGNTLVAGRGLGPNSINNFLIARYTPEGSIDSSFATVGYTLSNVAGGLNDSMAHAIATDSFGKIIAVGRAYGGAYFKFGIARYLTDGRFDSTFNNNGILIVDMTGFNNVARAVQIQADNKILVAGYAATQAGHTNYDFALARITTAGVLDAGFNGTGKAITSITPGGFNDAAYGMGLDPITGKIVLGGYTALTSADINFAIVRYNTTGLVDSAFASFGRKVVNVRVNGPDVANAVAIQTDGKIVATGYALTSTSNTYDMATIRLNTDGSLDSTFASVGIQKTDYGINRDETARAVVLQNDGKIIIAGRSATVPGPAENFTLVRYLTNGLLDTSFGSSGRILTSITNGLDNALSVDFQEGRIIASGSAVSATVQKALVLVRYNVDGNLARSGTLDASFGSSGRVETNITGGDDEGQAAILQPDNKLIGVGFTSTAGVADRFSIVRYKTDGTLDTTLGTTVPGCTVAAIGGIRDQAYAVDIDNLTGKIIVGGLGSNGANNDYALARFNTNGSLDTTFRTGGFLTTMSTGADEIYGVAVTPNEGKIVVAGRARNDFGVARFSTNGNLDSTFGSNGKMAINISATDFDKAVIIQADGKILVAGIANNGANADYAVIRINTTGILDSTFSTNGNGIALMSLGSSREEGQSIRLAPDGKIVVSGRITRTNDDFGVARLTTDGRLDTSFATLGILSTSVGNATDQNFDAAVQRNGKIVTVGDTGNDLAVIRYYQNGALDTGFATTGRITQSWSAGVDQAFSLAIQTDGRILIFGRSSSPTNDFAAMRFWP